MRWSAWVNGICFVFATIVGTLVYTGLLRDGYSTLRRAYETAKAHCSAIDQDTTSTVRCATATEPKAIASAWARSLGWADDPGATAWLEGHLPSDSVLDRPTIHVLNDVLKSVVNGAPDDVLNSVAEGAPDDVLEPVVEAVPGLALIHLESLVPQVLANEPVRDRGEIWGRGAFFVEKWPAQQQVLLTGELYKRGDFFDYLLFDNLVRPATAVISKRFLDDVAIKEDDVTYTVEFLTRVFAQLDEARAVRDAANGVTLVRGFVQYLILVLFIAVLAMLAVRGLMAWRWVREQSYAGAAGAGDMTSWTGLNAVLRDSLTHPDPATRLDLIRDEVYYQRLAIRTSMTLLPALGFIGTVLGITRALGNAGSIFAAAAVSSQAQQAAITAVSADLALAFATTFFALIANVILTPLSGVEERSVWRLIDRFQAASGVPKPIPKLDSRLLQPPSGRTLGVVFTVGLLTVLGLALFGHRASASPALIERASAIVDHAHAPGGGRQLAIRDAVRNVTPRSCLTQIELFGPRDRRRPAASPSTTLTVVGRHAATTMRAELFLFGGHGDAPWELGWALNGTKDLTAFGDLAGAIAWDANNSSKQLVRRVAAAVCAQAVSQHLTARSWTLALDTWRAARPLLSDEVVSDGRTALAAFDVPFTEFVEAMSVPALCRPGGGCNEALADAVRAWWSPHLDDLATPEISAWHVGRVLDIELKGGSGDLFGLEHAVRVERVVAREQRIVDIQTLAGLERLRHVDLSDNLLVDLAPLRGKPELREVLIDGNPLPYERWPQNCEVLNTLELHALHASRLGSGSFACVIGDGLASNLRRLDLSGQALAPLSTDHGQSRLQFPELVELKLTDAPIGTFLYDFDAPRLASLDISGSSSSGISDRVLWLNALVDDGMVRFPNLRAFYANRTMLNGVEAFLGALHQLEVLHLADVERVARVPVPAPLLELNLRRACPYPDPRDCVRHRGEQGEQVDVARLPRGLLRLDLAGRQVANLAEATWRLEVLCLHDVAFVGTAALSDELTAVNVYINAGLEPGGDWAAILVARFPPQHVLEVAACPIGADR